MIMKKLSKAPRGASVSTALFASDPFGPVLELTRARRRGHVTGEQTPGISLHPWPVAKDYFLYDFNRFCGQNVRISCSNPGTRPPTLASSCCAIHPILSRKVSPSAPLGGRNRLWEELLVNRTAGSEAVRNNRCPVVRS